MVAFAVDKTDRLFTFWFSVFFVGVPAAVSPACDQPHTEEGHGTAANEFSCISTRRPFEVAVEDGRSKNDRECEEDELHRNDLRGVETLQRAVDVLYLHDSSKD
jgi:hypothetical protein